MQSLIGYLGVHIFKKFAAWDAEDMAFMAPGNFSGALFALQHFQFPEVPPVKEHGYAVKAFC
jgi:hypothetical protein